MRVILEIETLPTELEDWILYWLDDEIEESYVADNYFVGSEHFSRVEEGFNLGTGRRVFSPFPVAIGEPILTE